MGWLTVLLKVETGKSLTVDEYLAKVFASVDLPDSIDR